MQIACFWGDIKDEGEKKKNTTNEQIMFLDAIKG